MHKTTLKTTRSRIPLCLNTISSKVKEKNRRDRNKKTHSKKKRQSPPTKKTKNKKKKKKKTTQSFPQKSSGCTERGKTKGKQGEGAKREQLSYSTQISIFLSLDLESLSNLFFTKLYLVRGVGGLPGERTKYGEARNYPALLKIKLEESGFQCPEDFDRSTKQEGGKHRE